MTTTKLTATTLWNDIKARAEAAGKIRRQTSETGTGTASYCSTLISEKQWKFLWSLCRQEGILHPADDQVLGLECGLFNGRLLKCGAVQVKWNEFTHNK